MFLLLPPSETKAIGGSGPPLDLDSLTFPTLRATRRHLIDALVGVCADLPVARRALSVAPTKDAEIFATAALQSVGTMPALQRYTGVLYDALDLMSLGPAARKRADERILITSALFGMLGATDLVPAYRLSAGSRLPGLPGIAAYWRPELSVVVKELTAPVVDLRSGAYAAFAPVPGAIGVRVMTEDAAGGRTVVSHFSKATKGLLARALIASRADIGDVAAVVKVGRKAGLRVERSGPVSIEVLT
jgi:cytoplasmic iron level regulating protein YaaA (DUF328/UPF0246 family)